jgi:L-glyceraldehyde 3-phosphate reductase
LTNKYYAGIPANSRAARAEGRSTLYDLRQHKVDKVNALEPLATKYGVSVGALVLAFYLTKAEVSSLLIGATSAGQIAENCAASGLVLEAQDVDRIDRAFSSYLNGPEA